MNTVLLLHSLVRYALLIIMIVGLVRTVITLARQATSVQTDQTLAAIFVTVFDLQALLGILIIFLGGFGRPLHTLLMFIALVFAHWMQSVANQSHGAAAAQLRIALYAVPLAITLFSLALIGHLLV